jgi:hypothetical protein
MRDLRGKAPVTRRTFAGNPYVFLTARPLREARLRSYIVRQHRNGRSLAAILEDSYLRRYGSESLCRRVLVDPRTIRALEEDVCEVIRSCTP